MDGLQYIKCKEKLFFLFCNFCKSVFALVFLKLHLFDQLYKHNKMDLLLELFHVHIYFIFSYGMK